MEWNDIFRTNMNVQLHYLCKKMVQYYTIWKHCPTTPMR